MMDRLIITVNILEYCKAQCIGVWPLLSTTSTETPAASNTFDSNKTLQDEQN